MRFIQYSIAWVTSALIVTMTGQVSVAFSITPSQPGAIDNWKMASGYITQDIFGRTVYGTTEVSTRLWTEPLPLGGSQIFNTTLLNWSVLSEQGFWGWDFKPAQQELMGSFEILNYVACAPQDPCGIEAPPPNNIPKYDGLGALININYHPAPTDPQPGQNRIHWIQIVRTNYGSGIPGIIPGTWFIDNRLTRDNPYYDTIGQADEYSFEDIPYNPIPFATTIENFFEAELYLAEETTSSESDKREVTIYNGIKWGWKNTIDEFEIQKTFVDSLFSSRETDSFQLSDLTPGAKFYAEINNDISGNVCNPNTYLEAKYGGNTRRYDNDSSPVGDGFASALTGNVSPDGTINLTVGAYGNGGTHIRGKDGGKYDLSVKVFQDENDFPYVIGASSGGGGVGTERPGTTQQNPILPNARDGNWQVFSKVPGCRWYDPQTTYGFEFQALDDTLFSEILDFPVGPDNKFTVSVGDTILGEFSPGQNVDFTSLFGSGISNFKITGIDSLFGLTEETAFPIQLAFNDRIGSFKMRPFSQESSPQSVPESTSTIGLLVLSAWGIIKAMKIRFEK